MGYPLLVLEAAIKDLATEFHCEVCKSLISRTKRQLQGNLSKAKLKNKSEVCFCCGPKCIMLWSHRNHEISKAVVCSQCGVTTHKNGTHLRESKSDNHFCSKSCAASYNNTHKKTGIRRSKLEKWVEARMQAEVSTPIEFNGKGAIGSELDIFIPRLKLAFELNGILHYKPIYGSEKLLAIQRNDALKEQACKHSGIKLIVIDCSKHTRVNDETCMKYLLEILGAIKIRTCPKEPGLV